MANRKQISTLPMKTTGTQHLIERTYRESGKYQWAREVIKNSLEAGATRVDMGIEWQAVENKGVYRRIIADNGKGMTPNKLVEFFNTFGGGGKPIGGVHENFGVGSKTSLLPWNRHGLVVISWVKGEASMIWVRQDRATGEYGLRLFRSIDEETQEETSEAVVQPFNDPHSGCDWSKIKPDFIGDNGTVIVLMGNQPSDDTVMGDPTRDEADLKGLAAYLNRRFWTLPEGTSITIDELRTSDKKRWPHNEGEAHNISQGRDGVRTQTRTILGAQHYIVYPVENFTNGKLAAEGTLEMKDKTRAHWFLWEGDRPGIHSYAANTGFITALYKDELYDTTSHLSVYRSFGVTDPGVRSRLWIVLEAPVYDEKTKHGVYPRTDRSTLLMAGGPEAGSPLPMSNWGAEFADHMPEAIRDALAAAHKDTTGSLDDKVWRERIAERFGDRWRVAKFRLSPNGDVNINAEQLGGEPVVRPRRPKDETVVASPSSGESSTPRHNVTGTGGVDSIGISAGPHPAEKIRLGVNIPHYRIAPSDELEPGMIAAWAPKDPEYPSGVVLLNASHPVLQQQIEYWRSQYADHLAHDIEREVLDVYGQVAVSKIAHSERLKGILPAPVVEQQLRSDISLTMSLLGLMAEESLIAARLGAKMGRRRNPEAVAHE